MEEKGRVAARRRSSHIAIRKVSLPFTCRSSFPICRRPSPLVARHGPIRRAAVLRDQRDHDLHDARSRPCTFSGGAAHHIAFYIKRFFRIAPLYYAAIAIYGLISWGALHWGLRPRVGAREQAHAYPPTSC